MHRRGVKMGENLYVGSHRTSNKAYREGWERTFNQPHCCDKDGNYRWWDIQATTGLPEERCKELEVLFKEIEEQMTTMVEESKDLRKPPESYRDTGGKICKACLYSAADYCGQRFHCWKDGRTFEAAINPNGYCDEFESSNDEIW
jgi:hypothetical protein